MDSNEIVDNMGDLLVSHQIKLLRCSIEFFSIRCDLWVWVYYGNFRLTSVDSRFVIYELNINCIVTSHEISCISHAQKVIISFF